MSLYDVLNLFPRWPLVFRSFLLPQLVARDVVAPLCWPEETCWATMFWARMEFSGKTRSCDQLSFMYLIWNVWERGTSLTWLIIMGASKIPSKREATSLFSQFRYGHSTHIITTVTQMEEWRQRVLRRDAEKETLFVLRSSYSRRVEQIKATIKTTRSGDLFSKDPHAPIMLFSVRNVFLPIQLNNWLSV